MPKRKKPYVPHRPVKAFFDDNHIYLQLADETVISNSLELHPWLMYATPEQQSNFELYTYSIYWPDLDEGLDIEGIVQNIPSKMQEMPSGNKFVEALKPIVRFDTKNDTKVSYSTIKLNIRSKTQVFSEADAKIVKLAG